ncbi:MULTISPECIES: DJ-1/PfpI family protein [Providencia]|uniref:DJ-1/PfpI family protein n=1 Tax=Providencia stuartii TaxID=588 RepID=A0AAI9MVI5_PROST|nr:MULTISPECIES: DJ-1/PfpI family protein [Providencia]ELR5045432.1 DJ-1/PfpI family protein [Providencia rettgeri]ELR5034150.1 DJ-1/PfpI family protein [Providencia stuartii]ELR5119474.1 DJ-1/PfpI family protein [Providencia stuartii]ELR5290589.1 DJ-1/PfpI family protein [Providencia stuartii]ELZ5938313.1 DJ-1/PfpI family protein [Providencia stuartii]
MFNVAIVIFDEFTDIDYFLMRDIFGRCREDWNVSVLGTKPYHTSTLGQKVDTDGHVSLANQADVVLFSSGQQGIPNALADEDFMRSFKLDSQRQIIGSICAGSFILHQLGLLDNTQATTHPDAKNALISMGADVEDKPLVIRGNIGTAGGCLSALYLTGWIAEKLFDSNKRREMHRQILPANQHELYEKMIVDAIAEAKI